MLKSTGEPALDRFRVDVNCVLADPRNAYALVMLLRLLCPAHALQPSDRQARAPEGCCDSSDRRAPMSAAGTRRAASTYSACRIPAWGSNRRPAGCA